MNRRTPSLVGAMLPALVLLCGCVSMQATEWKGHRIDEVSAKLGPPTQRLPSGDETVVYVFEQTKDTLCGISPTDPVPGQVQGELGGVGDVKHRKWTFVVDGNGVIVSWKVGEWQRWEQGKESATLVP